MHAPWYPYATEQVRKSTKLKIRDLIRELEKDGWYLAEQEGSHRQYRHPVKLGKATVSYPPGAEIPAWYANKIRKQAGLR